MNNQIIKLTKISKKYTVSENEIEVLKNINLKVNKGDLIAITGH